MHLLLLVDRPDRNPYDNFSQISHGRAYPIEGEIRKGYNIPLVSNMTLRNVRIKKECAAKYLRDLGAINLGGKLSRNHKHHISPIIRIGVNILRKVLNFKDIDFYPIDPTPLPFHGFIYVLFIGAIEDPVDERGCELL